MAQISVDEREEDVVVTGTGELDLGIGPQFDRTLNSAVISGKHLTVDLSEADFIDSAILAALAKNGNAMLDRNDRMRVIVTDATHPNYVLKTVGFRDLMDIIVVEEVSGSN